MTKKTQPTRPLFSFYPVLKGVLPHSAMGELPTPVQHAPLIDSLLPLQHLYIKRDDFIQASTTEAALFARQSLRKLEFLLGEVTQTLHSCGVVGSDDKHAVATARYARKLGLDPTTLLESQQPTASFHGMQEQYNMARAAVCSPQTQQEQRSSHGSLDLSDARAAIGLVNAAFELKEQIEAGFLPEPDRVYVPCVSGVTLAGLVLGFRIAGLSTTVVGVRVAEDKNHYVSKKRVQTLIQQTNRVLHNYDVSFPLYDSTLDDIVIRDVHTTKVDDNSVRMLMKTRMGIDVDTHCAAQVISRLVLDAHNNELLGKNVLLWHTASADEFEDRTGGQAYHELPEWCLDYVSDEDDDEAEDSEVDMKDFSLVSKGR